MKKATLFYLTILFSFPVFSQEIIDKQRYADSLQKVLELATSDSAKAMNAFLLSDHYSYFDTVSARNYLNKAKSYVGNNKYLQGVYWFYDAGMLWGVKNDVAKERYLRCDSILQNIQSPKAYYYRSQSWRNYGTLLQQQDAEHEMVRVITDHAIPLAQKGGNKEQEGNHFMLIGQAFMNGLIYDKANENFNRSLALLRKNHTKKEYLLTALDNTTKNYVYMDSLGQAKKLLNEYKNLTDFNADNVYLLDYYHTSAIYYRKAGNLTEALNSIEKGEALAKKINNAYLLQSLNFQKYKVYDRQERYTDAINVLLALLGNEKYTSGQNRLNHYYALNDLYLKLGDTATAYTWLKKYSGERDTAFIKGLEEKLTETEAKFRNAENEKNIAVLSAKNAEATAKVESSRLNNLLLLSFATLSLLAIIALYSHNKQTKLVAKEKEAGLQLALSEAAQREQLATAEAMLEGEEKERRRVARDLHDGLGGSLAGIKIKLSGFENSLIDKKNKDQIIPIIKQLDNTVSELRKIARNMMPETLLRFGLQTALQDLCESLTTDKTIVTSEFYGIAETIHSSQKVIIYRIVQEALANALKHAKASKILVQCSQNKNAFLITVEDNGVGFDVNDNAKKEGIGLANIRSRVNYLDGKMEINSVPYEGTTLNIELNVTN